MKLEFTKGQALGNDFVIIEDLDSKIVLKEKEIALLCDRRYGVGADGLMLVRKFGKDQYEMVFYNNDGSRAEVCGNGLRCFGRYLNDKGITEKEEIMVMSGGKIRKIRLHFEGKVLENVEVDMGSPGLLRGEVPMTGDPEMKAREEIALDGKDMVFYGVSMGNPHAVALTDKVGSVPLERWGPLVENHSSFPERTNVEFIEVIDRGAIRMKVWERGVGVTPACGSGACASAVVARTLDLVDRTVKVQLDGGLLVIDWNQGDAVKMTGPAKLVFEGTIEI